MKLINDGKNTGALRTRTRGGHWPWRRAFWGLLMVWLGVVGVSSLGKSPVMDEPPHIAAGMTYWKFFDFRLNPEHPPLIKLLSALPVMLLDRVPVAYETANYYVNSWFKSDQYTYGYYLLFRTGINPREVVFHARLVPMLLGALGGWLAFWWGWRLSGRKAGGFLSAALLCLYPEYAGHARFVTLDVPTLVGCAGVSAMAYRWWLKPSRGRALGFAAVAAVGSLVKLPVSVFIIFTLMALGGMALVNRKRLGFWRFVELAVAAGVCMYAAAWAGAGFRYSLDNSRIGIEERSEYAPANGDYGASALGKTLTFIARYRLLPEASLAVIYHTGSFGNRNYFFWGEWAREGWYAYFFGTFLLKTSIVMMGVYGAAAVSWWLMGRRMTGKRREFEMARLFLFGFPFVALFVLFVLGKASLGHRYILFVYFPLSVMAGSAMARWWVRWKAGRFLVWAVMGYSVQVFAIQYPHYETYFNEVIRTPYRGMKYLNDSNIDWGADMPLLGEQIKDYGIKDYNFAFFGAGKPGAYGLYNYRWILPNYPFAVFQDGKSSPPDPNAFSVMSLNALNAVRAIYPGRFNREPAWVGNSVVIFKPESVE